MKKQIVRVFFALVVGAGFGRPGPTRGTRAWVAAMAQQKPVPGGFIVEHDADIARNEPGTHDGGGTTTGYSFFSKVPKLAIVFRKRAFHAGSGIGYHLQTEDEIYYVLSGKGEMTVDNNRFAVGAGTAVLTRPGSSHGLKQIGAEDLVVLINYEQAVK